MDSELDRMKRIDLRAYAAAHGYELDRKESWKGSAVMRSSASHDKIIIKRGSDGHYVYFSVHQEDNGTIIDFVQKRMNMSLGAVRKELRPWIGMPPVPVPHFAELPKTSKDRLRVETEYAKTREAPRHPYLENERALPASLIGHARFAGRIRIDARGNAVFPHFYQEGLCGFELKNSADFTGFSSGGTKGLWMSNAFPDDNRLVFAESAIDALSFGCIHPEEHTRYASIGGKMNPVQPELIRASIARMPSGSGSEIVAAMDADEEGRKLAEVVRRAFDLSGRGDLRFVMLEPFGYKDWNDQLRAGRKSVAPASLNEPSVP